MSKTKLDCLKLINSIENLPEFKKHIITSKKILIAYSGGQDSSSLLAIFYILSKKWKFQLGVIYCNHGWTQSTQATLAAFKVVQNYKLPFYFIDIAPEIIEKSENKARQWRYTAFEEVMQHGKYDLLLTGHTLSDKTETILFNLCRGAGLKGACSLKTFKTFNKPFQNQKFKFKYQTMNLADVIINNSLYNFFRLTKPINQKNFYELFSFYILQCYLKKKIAAAFPLVALPFFSLVFKKKIKHWQLYHLTLLCNLAIYWLKHNANNKVGFNNVIKKVNFVSQNRVAPKIQQRHFICAFLYHTPKKKVFHFKYNVYCPLKLENSYINCQLENKTRKKHYFIKQFSTEDSFSIITFFNPATYISARRFLFNRFISQTKISANEYKINKLKNTIFLQSSLSAKQLFCLQKSLFTPADTLVNDKLQNFLNCKEIPIILLKLVIDQNFFCKQTSRHCFNGALQLFANKKLNKINKNFCTTYKPERFNFLFLKKNYWLPIGPIAKPTVVFNVNHSFYEFLFGTNKFNLLLKKKTKEKINFSFAKQLREAASQSSFFGQKKLFFFNKCIKSKTFNNYYTLSCKGFLKNNCHFSNSIEQRCFFVSKKKYKKFDFLSKSVFDPDLQGTKRQNLFLVNFPPIRSAYFIYLNKQRDFLFLKQHLWLEKKIVLKYFIGKSIVSPFLFNQFCKKKTLYSNQYCLQFKLRILRPLLKIDRSTIFLFTTQLNLPIFFDQSNNDLNITRNFIRKKIIPLLKEVNPKVEQNIYKFSQIANFYYLKAGHIQCAGDVLKTFKP